MRAIKALNRDTFHAVSRITTQKMFSRITTQKRFSLSIYLVNVNKSLVFLQICLHLLRKSLTEDFLYGVFLSTLNSNTQSFAFFAKSSIFDVL